MASSALEARQDEPQNAELLPKVTLADVPRSLPELTADTAKVGASLAHHYSAATNGLLYLQLALDLPALDQAELSQFPLFCEYLTELGTRAEDYMQTQARRALVGNIGAYVAAHTSLDDINVINGRLVITAKGLERKSEGLIHNLFEVLDGVRFDDSARLQDLLAQSRVDVEASITDRGHQLAMLGAARGLSAVSHLDDLWEGPSNITFVQELDRSCQENRAAIDDLTQSFERIRTKILCAPWRVLVVGEREAAATAVSHLQSVRDLPTAGDSFAPCNVRQPEPLLDCAWVTNTQLNFCASAYPAVTEGHNDAAALSVLAKFLTDGYLHSAIREKGGAYGAGAQLDYDSATFRFFSYRDPRLGETLDDFARALDWLDAANDAQRLEESILGVIRNLDTPRTPAGAAIHAFYNQLDGRSQEFEVNHRDAVLNTTYEDVCTVAQKYLDEQMAARAVITDGSHTREVEKLQLMVVKL